MAYSDWITSLVENMMQQRNPTGYLDKGSEMDLPATPSAPRTVRSGSGRRKVYYTGEQRYVDTNEPVKGSSARSRM